MNTSNKVWIISRLSNPVNISYDGRFLQIPPHGKCKVLNKNLIGAIPKGVVIIEDK